MFRSDNPATTSAYDVTLTADRLMGAVAVDVVTGLPSNICPDAAAGIVVRPLPVYSNDNDDGHMMMKS